MRFADVAYVTACAAWRSFKAAKAVAINTWRSERNAIANIDLIRNSEFFDAEWYIKNNPDVEASGMDPALHYATHGHYGNRNPSPYFVNEEYYALHNDVRASKMNPLLHFEKYGRREGRSISLLGDGYHKITYAEHQAEFPAKCAAISEKVKSGGRVKVVFFVSAASMFPARPLFEVMLRDAAFDPYVCVIPDLRWRDGAFIRDMEACEVELRTIIPEGRLIIVRPDEFGLWPDVLSDADIACYPSPYELSSFRYNPRYSVGRGFLPICVNYGYYRSVYDRHVMGGQSYAYMWKAFFECEDTLAEYRVHSAIGGTNGDLVGYIKMDRLADINPASHLRKRILIAPHHSVDGGTNKMLSLSNFARYADFFLRLPDRYPDIDFVFRPHPFLFKVLLDRGIWSPEKVAAYQSELRAKANVIWSDGGDYFTEFAESDGCIQDCGSYLVEYFYTGKPCCYMLKSPDDISRKFAPLGQKCLDNCYQAYDILDIDKFITEVIVGGRDKKADSRQVFAKTAMLNYPHAADVALQHIKEALS